MSPLPENLILQITAEIHDPVTTTDELIPSGETSSYRSNPLGLAEFTLSRKAPDYVPLSKEIHKAQEALEAGGCAAKAVPFLAPYVQKIKANFEGVSHDTIGVGSAIFAVKPGDGSAREQAASCQKVLGGWANFAFEYATKRYRSNVINWGMLPFVLPAPEGSDLTQAQIPFAKEDIVFFPQIRGAVEEKAETITGYVITTDDAAPAPFTVSLGALTDEERQIILDGCLINYNGRSLK